MRFDVITVFPEIVSDYKKLGIIARAISKKLISIHARNLRDYAVDERKTVDDRPYGGGFGMVLKPDIMLKAIKDVAGRSGKKTRIILLTPAGRVFSQAHAKRLANYDRLVLVSGRYEGFDERISKFVDEEISIGDYVLMGGELPALVMIEAISRFIPGVVGKQESVQTETFSDGILEYPQYTRPEILKAGKKYLRVPKILLSGDHKKIEIWRADQALKKTKKIRPDLIKKEF
ncbi:tRNA (guanosine(37)-N1)-methyltransferase TrmD [Patescibacteria group bacterium]|nr:tRNA (guanosine(37)-N1)-methyltransferase TrmD [Patescibacteria group bacterium]